MAAILPHKTRTSEVSSHHDPQVFIRLTILPLVQSNHPPHCLPTSITQGIEIIKQAVLKDNENNLEEALSLYKQGLGYFVTGLKYMKNEKSKAAIRERMNQYIKRAEEIKTVST